MAPRATSSSFARLRLFWSRKERSSMSIRRRWRSASRISCKSEGQWPKRWWSAGAGRLKSRNWQHPVVVSVVVTKKAVCTQLLRWVGGGRQWRSMATNKLLQLVQRHLPFQCDGDLQTACSVGSIRSIVRGTNYNVRVVLTLLFAERATTRPNTRPELHRASCPARAPRMHTCSR